MLVYDITNEKSFDNIRNWMRNIEEVRADSSRATGRRRQLTSPPRGGLPGHLGSWPHRKLWWVVDWCLQHASSDVERMLLGNKCDTNDKRQVAKERGEKVGADPYRRVTSFLPILNILCCHAARHRLLHQVLRNQRQGRHQCGGGVRCSSFIDTPWVTAGVTWCFLHRPSWRWPETLWADSAERWRVRSSRASITDPLGIGSRLKQISFVFSPEWKQPIRRRRARENHRAALQEELLQVLATVGGARTVSSTSSAESSIIFLKRLPKRRRVDSMSAWQRSGEGTLSSTHAVEFIPSWVTWWWIVGLMSCSRFASDSWRDPGQEASRSTLEVRLWHLHCVCVCVFLMD